MTNVPFAQGYPTLFFVPAAVHGTRPAPIAYLGDRSAEAMTAFIKTNANSLKVTD